MNRKTTFPSWAPAFLSHRWWRSGPRCHPEKQKILPIIRTDAGGFFGFGESDLPEYDNIQGRFAEILPPHPPSKEMQGKARLLLKAMGIADSDLLQGEARWS